MDGVEIIGSLFPDGRGRIVSRERRASDRTQNPRLHSLAKGGVVDKVVNASIALDCIDRFAVKFDVAITRSDSDRLFDALGKKPPGIRTHFGIKSSRRKFTGSHAVHSFFANSDLHPRLCHDPAMGWKIGSL